MENTPLIITFLGTGTSTGVPVIACECPVCKSPDPRDKRLRASLHIKSGDTSVVIDCGPDFRMQMIQSGVTEIDAILLTHEHRDHIGGLDDVRAYNYILNKAIDIYCTQRVYSAIQNEFAYIFSNTRFFGAPQLLFHIIKDRTFNINGIVFQPIESVHGQIPVTGFRINNFAYLTDVSRIDSKELLKLEGVKVLVINALRNSRHTSHLSLSEAVDIIEKLKCKQGYITHISHFLGTTELVELKLPKHIKLAFDGLKIIV